MVCDVSVRVPMMLFRAARTVLGVVLAAWAGWGVAAGASFEASHASLAPSPLRVAASWYSGAVTRDGMFLYGLGHSHNAYGNNSLWLYDPGTNSHENVFPDTGGKWRWQKDKAGPGHWAALDPAADKALYAFFGGPDIRALTNRNNHQAFYLPARDEFWVLAGTTFYQSSPYFAGRFSLKKRRWVDLSANLAEFSAGLIVGSPGWVAPNAATAVCGDLNTVVLFGGMNGTGGVRIIEPNPEGPEPYRWASAPVPPIHQPAENVRHNAVCVGDTVYFVEGQRRVPDEKCCRTPDPAAFWKFHVPTRTWTRLPEGPAGAYFTVMTHDSAADALLVFGGSGGANPANRLWVYDLRAGAWQNLTDAVPNLPRADMHTGGYIPGFGHVYKGGRRFNAAGKDMGYGASAQMMKILLRRVPGADQPRSRLSPGPPEAVLTPPTAPSTPGDRDPSIARRIADRRQTAQAGASSRADAAGSSDASAAAPVAGRSIAERVSAHRPPAQSASPRPARPAKAVSAAYSQPKATGGAVTWARIPLPGKPNSPQGTMKHQRLVEGPDGRVYLLGGDWGGDGGDNTGRQEVYSFNPLSPTGDWRLEAPYCGTAEHPVHWHTDEAGVAWDARRKVFWKIAGTEYGPGNKDPSQDACLSAGRSVKAKVITFDPATRRWAVPPHVAQTRFGYVTNGVLDPDKDEMVQVIDKAVQHLNLATGRWTSHALPGGVLRFNAIAARVGREVYWCNRRQVLESYHLDTHALTTHSPAPWPAPATGWEMQMVMPYGARLLVVRPTSRADTPRHAALYDPATKQWTVLDPGEGWGNTGMVHSSGRLVLMGGGIDGPAYHNRQVWVGDLP